jgi:hypothetical protein
MSDDRAGEWLPAIAARPLRELSLRDHAIGMTVVDELADAPAFATLERLDLFGTNVGEEDVFALCNGKAPLVHLELSRCSIGPAAVEWIAREPRFAALRYLGLADTNMFAEGLAALLASPYLSRDLVLAIDGRVLGMSYEPWYDTNWNGHSPEPVQIGGSWQGEPPPEVRARFPKLQVLGPWQ